MKKYIFILTGFISLFISFSSYSNECKDYGFSKSQLNVLRESFKQGDKHNLGLSLAAIAYQESNLGEYLINWNDPSFGVYHVLLTTAANTLNVKGYYNKVLLAQKLMNNREFSGEIALLVLEFWKGYLEKRGEFSWTNLWGAYNAGSNYDGSSAKKYAENIKRKIGIISKCVNYR